MNPPMVAGLVEAVQLAQQHTWFMVVLLWLSAGVGYRLLSADIQDNADAISGLADDHQELGGRVQRVDLKQDHIAGRQELIMEQIGVNEEAIQKLKIHHARLDDDGAFSGEAAADGGAD